MLAGYPPFYDENPFGIYQKILAGKVEFPRHFDVHAKDLVKKLLSADRTKRIGNLKSGAEDIKKHKWFKGFDWGALLNYSYQSPIVPDVRSDGDTQNFDRYPESVDDHSGIMVDEATSQKVRWRVMCWGRAALLDTTLSLWRRSAHGFQLVGSLS